MTRVAGEVADGVIIHPFSNEKYIREVTLPAVEEGLKRSGRSRENFEIIYSPFIISGKDEKTFEAQKLAAKNRIAFYGSTPHIRMCWVSTAGVRCKLSSTKCRSKVCGKKWAR